MHRVSAPTAVKPPRYCSIARKWPPFPAWSLAHTARVICVFLSPRQSKRSKPASIHSVATCDCFFATEAQRRRGNIQHEESQGWEGGLLPLRLGVIQTEGVNPPNSARLCCVLSLWLCASVAKSL